MAPNRHTDDATDVLTADVDADLLAEVAEQYGMGAGAVKGALEHGVRPDSGNVYKAAREAVGRQIQRDNADYSGVAIGLAVIHQRFGTGEVVEKGHRGQQWRIEFGSAGRDEWLAPDAVDTNWMYYVDNPEHALDSLDVSAVTGEQEPEPDSLSVGDTFHLPNGCTIVVVGVADAEKCPIDGEERPLYEAEVRNDGWTDTKLYGPHNIRYAVEGGAEYGGETNVDDVRTPFWCEGCEQPHTADERRHDPLLDASTCSYGCSQEVSRERIKTRMEERQ